MRTPFRIALLAACLAAPIASVRADAQTIVLDGTIADGTPRYFTIPFTVPAGTVEIAVHHDDMSAMNILDWGLRDPTRFRGWGGGNTEDAVVGVDAASRSYVPGAIPAGEWSVMIGPAKILERPARYHVEITFRTTATLAPQPERRPYADAPALSTGPRWYAGDFHVHDRESGDAEPTLDTIATFARTQGLDFVELSDHNVVTQLDFVGDAQSRHPDLLFLPGSEFTTYAGHANAIGITQWVDFTAGTDPGATIGPALDAIAAQHGVFAINHPVLDLGDQCIGCSWQLAVPHERVNAIEIQNGQYSRTGPIFYRRAIAFWEGYLAEGHHVAPIGGSDDHSAGVGTGMFDSPVGGPTTMVYATELSAAAIVAAVAAGRTVVKLQGASDPMIELTAGASLLGDTVRSRHATLQAIVTGANGMSLRFVRNGMTQPSIPVTSEAFTTTLEVDAPPGTNDDRWRCELIGGGIPRVITGHIWMAATGDPIPVDAGTDAAADVAAGDVLDGGTTPTAGGGCGCHSVPIESSRGLGALACLALGTVAMRRRRRA